MKFTHKFVDLVPEDLVDGVVYVSIKYKTASHRCACGCGREVVTPLSPVYWKLTFDGETISLHPSIGNWEFPCRSHYWVTKNRVEWSGDWTEAQVEAYDANDLMEKEGYYAHTKPEVAPAPVEKSTESAASEGAWSQFKKRWLRW